MPPSCPRLRALMVERRIVKFKQADPHIVAMSKAVPATSEYR